LPLVDAPRTRRTFARLNRVQDVPNLIDIQRRSFAWLTDPEKGGLRETISDISPIEDYTGNLAVDFGEFHFDDPVASIEECREKDLTYARPLTVTVAFVNRETGEIREQSVFMGDFPWMTERGTFIINGTERVVVTQLVRSPGAYLMEAKDREKQVFIANLMPARGSWLELEIDKKGKVFVRIDRKRKLPVTVLLRAMGYATDEEIVNLFDNSLYIRNTIEADTEPTKTEEGGNAWARHPRTRARERKKKTQRRKMHNNQPMRKMGKPPNPRDTTERRCLSIRERLVLFKNLPPRRKPNLPSENIFSSLFLLLLSLLLISSLFHSSSSSSITIKDGRGRGSKFKELRKCLGF